MVTALVIVLVSAGNDELAERLAAAGHNVLVEATPYDALAHVEHSFVDAFLLDRMADAAGAVLELRRFAALSRIFVLSRAPTVDEAVQVMKAGADEYLPAHGDPGALLELLVPLLAERERRVQAGAVPRVPALVGTSPAILHLCGLLDLFSRSDEPVLITGETGSGKEVVAHALHDMGRRASQPFVAVNCAAFPDTLLEAELFGHERGAFTGAVRRRDGRFKAADHGTLLLDEIGEMSIHAQAKLLRVLQERRFEPLGTNVSVQFDVRILASTHRDLKDMVAAGTFREDLYYRLKILELTVPPLRDRRADIPLLVEHFLHVQGETNPRRVSPRALAALSAYPFPGNVRELEHALRYAMAVAADAPEIEPIHLPAEIVGHVVRAGPTAFRGTIAPLHDAMDAFESDYIRHALILAHGVKRQAAELLGISRKNLWEKSKRLGIATDRSAAFEDLDAEEMPAPERPSIDPNSKPPRPA